MSRVATQMHMTNTIIKMLLFLPSGCIMDCSVCIGPRYEWDEPLLFQCNS